MKLFRRTSRVDGRLGWNLLMGGLVALGTFGLGLAVFSLQAAGEGTYPVQLGPDAGADYSSDPETFRFAEVQQGIWRDLPAVPTRVPPTGSSTPLPALAAPLATATPDVTRQVRNAAPTLPPDSPTAPSATTGVTRTPPGATATPPQRTPLPTSTPDLTSEIDPAPSPTPTPAPSLTATHTPTHTPGPTVTPSLTPEPSPTLTPSLTPDPSPTAEPSQAPTATPTPTGSPAPANTATPSSQDPTPPD